MKRTVLVLLVLALAGCTRTAPDSPGGPVPHLNIGGSAGVIWLVE